MTDNGSCYKAFDFRDACRDLDIKHIRTKPYTPKTNGKAGRFIQTALREWAYAQAYPTSDRRAQELPIWLHQYNWHRPLRREATTRHDRTDSGSASAGASRMESGKPAPSGNATGSAN